MDIYKRFHSNTWKYDGRCSSIKSLRRIRGNQIELGWTESKPKRTKSNRAQIAKGGWDPRHGVRIMSQSDGRISPTFTLPLKVNWFDSNSLQGYFILSFFIVIIQKLFRNYLAIIFIDRYDPYIILIIQLFFFFLTEIINFTWLV